MADRTSENVRFEQWASEQFGVPADQLAILWDSTARNYAHAQCGPAWLGWQARFSDSSGIVYDFAEFAKRHMNAGSWITKELAPAYISQLRKGMRRLCRT